MPVYKDNERGTWYFDFKRVYNGKSKHIKRRGFNTKKEAQMAEIEAIQNIGSDKKETTESKIITLNDLFKLYNIYRLSKVKITTIEMDKQKYRSQIEIIGNTFLDELSHKQVFQWRQNLIDKNMCEKHTNLVIRLLKHILEFGLQKNYPIDSSLLNELENVKMNKLVVERSVWSFEEVQLFLSTFAMDNEKEIKYHDYFEVLFFSGMRPNEFRCLKKSDIQGEYLSVNKNMTSKIKGKRNLIMTTKNKNSIRKVLMPKEIIDKLNYRTQYFEDYDFIFGKDKPMSESCLTRELHSHAKIAGLPQIVIYGFRHSHATHLIRSGVPIKVVSKRLGHKTTSTTMNTYWHMFKEDENIAVEALKIKK